MITRVVDYGGLFFDDVLPGQELLPQDHRSFRPAGWIEAGRERLDAMRPIAERAGLTTIQLACQWNLAHDAVRCVVPTLIQEAGPAARPVEDKRAELAALPGEERLSPQDVGQIRAIGDNTGCMALKGASPTHAGEERPDRWADGPATRVRGPTLGDRARARSRPGGRVAANAPPRERATIGVTPRSQPGHAASRDMSAVLARRDHHHRLMAGVGGATDR